MPRRAAVLTTMAVLFTSVLAVTLTDGPAFACSCSGSITLLDQLDAAEVIVRGEPIEQFDDTGERGEPLLVWRFRVDERFRGDTPAVIDLQAYALEDSCGLPPEIGPSVLALSIKRANGRFDVSAGCWSPMVDESFVDQLYSPPTLDGTGPPAALVAADARGERLAVVDELGGVLAYLPSEHPTFGLALCPGDEVFVQLRATSQDQWGESIDELELARWSIADWTEIDVTPIFPVTVVGLPPPIECRRPDGGDVAYVTYGGATTITDGTVSTAGPSALIVPGPDAAQLIVSIDDATTRVSSGTVETDVTQFFDDGLTRQFRPEALWSVQPTEEGWIVDFDDYVQIDSDTGRRGLRRGQVTPDGVLTPLSPLIEIPTLGHQVGLVLPAGLPAPPPGEAPIALLERSGTELIETVNDEAAPTTLSIASSTTLAVSTTATSVGVETSRAPTPTATMTSELPTSDDERGWLALGAVVLSAAGLGMAWWTRRRRRRP